MDSRTFLGLMPSHNPYRWSMEVRPDLCTGGGFLFGGAGARCRDRGTRGDERPVVRLGDIAIPVVRPTG